MVNNIPLDATRDEQLSRCVMSLEARGATFSRNFCRCDGTCTPFLRQPDDRLLEDTCREHVRICLATQRRYRSWRTSAMSSADQAVFKVSATRCLVLRQILVSRGPFRTSFDNSRQLPQLAPTANIYRQQRQDMERSALEIIAFAYYSRVVYHARRTHPILRRASCFKTQRSLRHERIRKATVRISNAGMLNHLRKLSDGRS